MGRKPVTFFGLAGLALLSSGKESPSIMARRIGSDLLEGVND